MHFNSYPDDWILLIFARLPLQTLLGIEIVCRRWQSVQQAACRQRHTLFLLVGNYALDYLETENKFKIPFADALLNKNGTRMFPSTTDIAKLHGLECDQLSKPICEWLVVKLPNVTSLQIAIGSRAYTMIEPIMSLLSGWSSKLITLDFWLENTAGKTEYFEDIAPKVQQQIAQDFWFLLGALNFLPALKNLTLDIGARFLGPDQMQRNNGQISLPFLSQLNQFYFSSYDQPDVILDSLLRYGEPNANLHQIGVCEVDITQECLDKFIQLSPELRSRFTHLLPLISPSSTSVLDYNLIDSDLDTVCSKFSSQTSLQFTIVDDISFSEIINTLSCLKKLSILGLCYVSGFNELHFTDPSILDNSIAQLTSVSVLYLDLCITSHTQLSQLNIGWIFPNLQALRIVYPYIKCTECVYDNLEEITTEQLTKCLTILLESLRKCTRLRTINFEKYNQYDYQLEHFDMNVIIKSFFTR